MREAFKRQGNVAKIVVVLLIGVAAGVLLGGVVHLFGSSGSNGAQAATSVGSTSPNRVTAEERRFLESSGWRRIPELNSRKQSAKSRDPGAATGS